MVSLNQVTLLYSDPVGQVLNIRSIAQSQMLTEVQQVVLSSP